MSPPFDPAILLSFTLISTANIVTPGPAILNTTRRALQLGFRRVVPTILGNALGLALAGTCVAGGVAHFVLASDLLWAAFRWLGMIYLGWLGLKLIVKREALDLGKSIDPTLSPLALLVEAFTLAATNPKAILFYMSLFPQVMQPNQPVLPQATILVAVYCCLSITSLSTYSALASALRGGIINQHRYTAFRKLSGVVLLGLAVKLAKDVLR